MDKKDNILIAKRNIIDKLWIQNNINAENTYPKTSYLYMNTSIDKLTVLRNFKNAWNFVLEYDTPINYNTMCEIHKLLNKDVIENPGYLRNVPILLRNTDYVPKMPIESIIKEELNDILTESKDKTEISIEIMLWIMKRQMFIDGNKRTAYLFANKIMIDNSLGIINIKDKILFYKKLKEYYELDNLEDIKDYLIETSIEKRLIK